MSYHRNDDEMSILVIVFIWVGLFMLGYMIGEQLESRRNALEGVR